MATTDNRVSNLLPSVGEWDLWPRTVKVARAIVAATSSDGDEDVVVSSSTDFVLWDVRAGTLVYKVTATIETAFTASTTLIAGDTTQTGGWFVAAELAATSTGILKAASTLYDDTSSANYPFSGGKYFETSGAIEVDLSGADPTVGRAIFYVQYVQLSS